VVSLKTTTTAVTDGTASGHHMSELVLKWVIERMVPSVIQRVFAKRLVPELGNYLLRAAAPGEPAPPPRLPPHLLLHTLLHTLRRTSPHARQAS